MTARGVSFRSSFPLILLVFASCMQRVALSFFFSNNIRSFQDLSGRKRSSLVRISARNRRGNRGSDPLAVEVDVEARGYHPIIGSDESGRGCIAGPVVAASCCILADLSHYQPIEGVADSKLLSPSDRERIFEEVTSHPNIYAWHISQRSSQDIDNSNIMIATMECFKDSIEGLVATLPSNHTAYSIVDGEKTPKLSVGVPCRPYVGGDKHVYTVSLASILAKVTRDRLAVAWHDNFPEYGFDQNKGYITPEHTYAIHKLGPCPLHRRSFKSLRGR